MKVSLALPGRTLYAKIWRMDVGSVNLYLLDTDIEDNIKEDREITYKLYGGSWENRFKQELLLGVGGIRLLDIIGIKPDLYHINEGHAAFIGIERLRKYVQDNKLSITEAVEIVRYTTLFTTHTPVPAGHDAFPEEMLRTYIPHYASRLNISWDEFMNYGRVVENDVNEKFSVSVLAAKLSCEINAVSRIHCNVSRQIFSNIYDGYFPEELDNIGYVTNGVHLQTWAAKEWQSLYENVLGNDYIENQVDVEKWKKIKDVQDDVIWKIRRKLKGELFDVIKERLSEYGRRRNDDPRYIIEVIEKVNSEALTIGFARRFATYKRASLIFKNLEQLSKIVNNEKYPVQFIFSGKAHPNDSAGKDLIRKIIEISRKPEFLGKIIFVEDYDMYIASKLVQGVDIWLNTPTRPLEASGTSGEKAIMNGVINFSVMDGWWAEAYMPGSGWSLKEEITYSNPEYQDQLDAETIYNILEEQIIPTYYNRSKDHIPTKWIGIIKNSIMNIAPRFNMKRMLNDYIEKYYTRMYLNSSNIMLNEYKLAKDIASWKRRIIRGWDSIEILSVEIPDSSSKTFSLGEVFKAKVVLDLNELSSDDIGVEIVFTISRLDNKREVVKVYELAAVKLDRNVVSYEANIDIHNAGVYDFAFRIFVKNKFIGHRQNFNLVKWI